ncbi:unnamed protein product [Vicia faba]|uniref:Uncharacterized protein n=1 Tax=Vicia faba TaxID=3906 RepID=A0AAV1AET7_VICFA|nr:unnamed protein product [Vicia faba]
MRIARSSILNHFSFTDEVLLFCHGDYQSSYLMLQGMLIFSKTSGLYPNKNKSEIYCSGLKETDLQRLLDAFGFSKSILPFKYLGMPINSKRFSAKDFQILVDKITTRIRIWSSRHLSFTGRVVLINSFILAIHSYWSQIIIIPKRVIKDITMICRAFWWTGKAT